MHLRFLLVILLMLGCCGLEANGQSAEVASAYQPFVFRSDSGQMPYRLLMPAGDTARRRYPLVLMLHGAGERGSDNTAQLKHGASLFLQPALRSRYPAFVVFPQCPADSYWSNVHIQRDSSGRYRQLVFHDDSRPTPAMYLLERLLDSLVQALPVDTNRMYVGGLSMGGMGTFELVGRHPGWFAAAFPICGGADTLSAVRLTLPRWWLFHGLADEVVPAHHSQRMVEALEKVGVQARASFYPGVGHNSWDKAFADPQLLPWLFSQGKEPAPLPDLLP
jgi:predicted peptidase